MENKSPFGVAESEFDEQGYDSTNESDLEISSDKKKKSKVSEIWKKLFSRESDEPDENQKSFVESFSSLFGRLIGVDRDSNEGEKGSQEYAEETHVNSFNIPLVNTTEVVNVDDTVINGGNYTGTEDDPRREYGTEKDEVGTVLELHDKVLDQTTIPDVRSRDSNDVFVEGQSDFDNIADVSQLSDLDAYEPRPTALRVTDDEIHTQHNQEEVSLYDTTRDVMDDQQVPQDIHHTGYEKNSTREEPISRGVAHNKDYADKDSLQKERESRRRLKRQTRKLRKRIDDLHSKQESHQKKLENLQKQEISQDAELLAMGKRELYSPREVPQKINNKNNSEKSGAIFATKYNIGSQSPDGSNIYKEAKDEVYGKRAHDRQTVGNDSRYSEREQRYNDRYKRINNENKPEIAINTPTTYQNLSEYLVSNEAMDSDSMLHRKIEAKDSDEKFQTAMHIKTHDEPGIGLEGAKSSSYGDNDHQVTKIKSLDNKISLLERRHQESRNATDEYRKAIKTGINTGIIMLVSLGLVALIWSLLN